MEAGRLFQRVTLESPPSPTASQNAIGEPTGAWTTIAEVWAEVLTTGGAEQVEGDRLKPVGTFAVTIRLRDDIDETCRVLWEGWDLRISTIGYPEIGVMTMDCLAAKV